MKKYLRDRLMEQVRNQMAARGHTQIDAALEMKTSQSQLSDILGGKRFGLRVASRLMDYADVSDTLRARITDDLVYKT